MAHVKNRKRGIVLNSENVKEFYSRLKTRVLWIALTGWLVLAGSGAQAFACPNLSGKYQIDTLDGWFIVFKQEGCVSVNMEIVPPNGGQSATFTYVTDGRLRKVTEAQKAWFGGLSLSIGFTSSALVSNNLYSHTNAKGGSVVLTSEHTQIQPTGFWDLEVIHENLDEFGVPTYQSERLLLKRQLL